MSKSHGTKVSCWAAVLAKRIEIDVNKTDITEKLIQFTTLLVGRFRGGLAQANIYASLIFGRITGVAVSDVSTLGTVFIPAMEKQG
jgi:TRAP-type C4-dicarboxylate transport system permease large subunit